MRVFSFLFALYFVLLGCVPCTDEVPLLGKEAGSAVVAAHTGHEEPGKADLCSPLCQCRCCPGGVLLPGRPLVFCPTPAPTTWGVRTYAPAGSDTLPVRPLTTPWQPPQGA